MVIRIAPFIDNSGIPDINFLKEIGTTGCPVFMTPECTYRPREILCEKLLNYYDVF